MLNITSGETISILLEMFEFWTSVGLLPQVVLPIKD